MNRICISIGDYNGIGPEVILKALSMAYADQQAVLIIGAPEILDHYARSLSLDLHYEVVEQADALQKACIYVLNPEPEAAIRIQEGILSADAGRHAMLAVEKGIELCLEGSCDALVTAPISKDAIQQAGYEVPGHTEFLADLTETEEVLMTLVSEGLRVALVTAHIPISDVSQSIRPELIRRKCEILNESLKADFGIPEPRIAVFGLNPHAGDGGVLGREEMEIIEPAIKGLQAAGIRAEGPFPADGFFGMASHRHYDAILAMYHDQGLVPFKALSFGKGVNFTAGLPIIRTSPDHGTAFAIAGQGKADPSSFIQALTLSIELAGARNG
jgi:4-hydroxythreonine-4-phosphate dehydrogenase